MISGTIGQNINFVPNPFPALTPTGNPPSSQAFLGGYPTSAEASQVGPLSPSWSNNLSPGWPSYPDLLTQAAVLAYALDPGSIPSQYSWRVYDQSLSDTPPDTAPPIPPSTLNPLFYWANWPDYVNATQSAQFPTAPYYAALECFASDISGGKLPAVSWIIPNQGFWEHPTCGPWNGALLISQVFEALLANPSTWSETVLIVTYDESDGHYDHVPPPRPSLSSDPDEFITGTFTTFQNFSPPSTTVTQQPIGAGFRVPMLVISPWTLNGGVCSDQYDHTSIIQFLEDVTGVACPNLTNWRRSTFTSLSTITDFTQPPPPESDPTSPGSPLANRPYTGSIVNQIATIAGVSRYNWAPGKVDDAHSSQWQGTITPSVYVPAMQQWPPVQQGCQVIMTMPSCSASQALDQAEIDGSGDTATFQNAFIVTVDGFEPVELINPLQSPPLPSPLQIALGPVVAVYGPNSDTTAPPACQTRAPTISFTDESGAVVANISAGIPQVDFDPNNTSTAPGVPQRFTFSYPLTLSNINDQVNGPFNFGANTVKTLTVNASFQSDTIVTSAAEFELVTGQDPQFYHDFYNDTSWLSGELRVFSLAAGTPLFGGQWGSGGADPLSFITSIINTLNANQRDPTNNPLPPGIEFPPGSGNTVTTFDNLNQDENENPLSLFVNQPGQVPMFNFALARVHMQSDAPATNVRVFFRSFRMSATDSVYVPTNLPTDLSPFRTNPPSLQPPGANDARIPLLGIGNVTVSPGQTALEYVTIPFFATVRIQLDPTNPGNLTMVNQKDIPNVAKNIPGSPGSPPTQTFFGCWLDINQDQNLFPVQVPANPSDWDSVGPNTPGAETILAAFTRDVHQCLVAEISFDSIQIPAGDTPTSSAWLAQRNLGFTEQ
jgi:Phosphoesterase family